MGTSLDSGRGELENAALLLSSDGDLLGKYAKRELLYFGEKSLQLGALTLPSSVEYSAGSEPVGLTVADWKIQVDICVEDTLSELNARDAIHLQPDLIVSLASDGWFSGDAASELHFQLSKLRAIENGVPLLRVTNRGVSALIDPVGRTEFRLPTAQAAKAVLAISPVSMGVVRLPFDRRLISVVLFALALLVRFYPKR